MIIQKQILNQSKFIPPWLYILKRSYHFTETHIKTAWFKSGTRTPGPGPPSHSLKVGPGNPLKFKSGTLGSTSKFKSGTPVPTSKFKSGTLFSFH